MCRGLFRCVTWICLLIILLTIEESQSSENAVVYNSETEEIIVYGIRVLDAIAKYPKNDSKIIDILRNIANESQRVRNLQDRSLSSILESCSCKENIHLNFIKRILEDIDYEYEDFENYFLKKKGEPAPFPRYLLFRFRTKILGSSLRFVLEWQNNMNSTATQELFQALVDNYNPMMENNCGIGQSLNQYIYNLYHKILLSIIKTYSIITYYFSHPYLEKILYKRTTIYPETYLGQLNMYIGVSQTKYSFKTNTLGITANVTNALPQSSRNILRRDPSRHIKGVTYDSLDHFLQDYVTDQIYLRKEPICSPMCSFFNDTRHHQHRYHITHNNFTPNLICWGSIRSCRQTDVTEVCAAPLNSARRYDGLNNVPNSQGSTKFWGHVSKKCTIYSSISIKSGQSGCNICACVCDMVDYGDSVRYIDLQPHMSNFNSSFVITGIRFRIIGQIVYLQIHEGQLRDGRIDLETLTWRKVQTNNITRDKNLNLYRLDFDNRLLDLTDLTLPNNYAVTMIKFTVVENIVGLQIEGFPIISGQLNTSISKKASNQSMETVSFKPVFQPVRSNIPTLKSLTNSMITEPNKFLLRFETSDWKNDAGQNVVPFIDLQSVVTDPPSPVTGVGMHIRYSNSSGGFLAPKLISTDNKMNVVQKNIRNIISPLEAEPDSYQTYAQSLEI